MGRLRVRVWLPIEGLGHVNVYVFTDGSETVLVDSGMFSAGSVHSLLQGLRRGGVDPRTVSRVLVTHYHVDHLTGSVILCEALGCEVYLAEGDYRLVVEKGVDRYVSEALSLFKASGVPPGVIEEIARYQPGLRLLEAYRAVAEMEVRPLRPGSLVELPGAGEYRVVEAPGHTPGHIILVSEGRREALVGDVILPGITPHVSLHSLESDPLKDYLRTLERVKSTLRGYTALPGHGDPLPDAAERAVELIRHHEARLSEVASIVSRLGEATAFEVAVRVTWSGGRTWEALRPAERYFAIAETLAHLKRLEAEGVVESLWRGDTLVWRPSGGGQ